MAGSPLKWLKARYLSGELKRTRAADARWPQLSKEISELQRAAPAGKLVGCEVRSCCPGCSGRLIVARETWRCLGCAAQEIYGPDLPGMLAFLSHCPKAAHK